MKYIITEQQYNLLTEDKILKLYFDTFNNDWDLLQRFLEKKGNPPYEIIGNLNLTGQKIKSLGNLVSVEGDLSLYDTNIKSLGNLVSVEGDLNLMSSKGLKSLGNLQSVGGFLDLGYTTITSLGSLKYVGKSISLVRTPLSEKMSEEEIRDQIKVGGVIFFFRNKTIQNFVKYESKHIFEETNK